MNNHVCRVYLPRQSKEGVNKSYLNEVNEYICIAYGYYIH